MWRRLIEFSLVIGLCASLLSFQESEIRPTGDPNQAETVEQYPLGLNALNSRKSPVLESAPTANPPVRPKVDWERFWGPDRRAEITAEGEFRRGLKPLNKDTVPFSIEGIYPGMSAKEFEAALGSDIEDHSSNWGCLRTALSCSFRVT